MSISLHEIHDILQLWSQKLFSLPHIVYCALEERNNLLQMKYLLFNITNKSNVTFEQGELRFAESLRINGVDSSFFSDRARKHQGQSMIVILVI